MIMDKNLQNKTGVKSASDALSKMKEERQRQTSTTRSVQSSKPRITTQNNTGSQGRYNENNDNDGKAGIGCFWAAICFAIGFILFSMF